MKLLVADDERWIRKGVRKMIEQGEHSFEEILEAGSLAEMEAVFLKERPEIVVSDVRFPCGTSCELCRKLYETERKTKFIMLSGYDDFAYVKAALGYKALDYLLKPVDKKVLNKVVQKAVEEYVAENGEKVCENREREEQEKEILSGDDIVKRIMEEIGENCAGKYTLKTFASKYHISEAYLSSLFAKTAGVSLTNYIMRERVERSAGLMLQTNRKISDIAMEVGYEDPRYFMKIFKKVTGETPTDYRARQWQEIDYEE